MEETIKKIQEAASKFEQLSKEEKDEKLKELDAETFYNRTKIYPEEEEEMRKEREEQDSE